MLKEDRNVLAMLVKEYSLKEVVRALAVIASESADEYSDMMLKEKSISLANSSDTLYEVIDKMSE
jgi:hypothetical protein